MEQIHRGLLKKFHTLCSALHLTDVQKLAIIESYGVDSSRDIDTHDLVDICAHLSVQMGERASEMDKLRKRVMAAIGGYLKATGRESNATMIKSIACRATGHSDFNKIPRERLRNLIAAFNDKVKDADAVSRIADSLLIQTLTNDGCQTQPIS